MVPFIPGTGEDRFEMNVAVRITRNRKRILRVRGNVRHFKAIWCHTFAEPRAGFEVMHFSATKQPDIYNSEGASLPPPLLHGHQRHSTAAVCMTSISTCCMPREMSCWLASVLHIYFWVFTTWMIMRNSPSFWLSHTTGQTHMMGTRIRCVFFFWPC